MYLSWISIYDDRSWASLWKVGSTFAWPRSFRTDTQTSSQPCRKSAIVEFLSYHRRLGRLNSGRTEVLYIGVSLIGEWLLLDWEHYCDNYLHTLLSFEVACCTLWTTSSTRLQTTSADQRSALILQRDQELRRIHFSNCLETWDRSLLWFPSLAAW